MSDGSKEQNPRIGQQTQDGDRHAVTIENLTGHEAVMLKQVLSGLQWTRKDHDSPHLIFTPATQPLPDPVEDPKLAPFWQPLDPGAASFESMLFDAERLGPHTQPSIIIQHLCGYDYTPEKYRQEAARLKSYGFEIMRSRRDDKGGFWELWYLPGLWCAKGDLAKALTKQGAKRLDQAVSFLCHRASFGTLDVCVQRAAMTVD